MTKPVWRRSKKKGLPPGTVVFYGEPKTERVRITVFDYDAERVEERELSSIEECYPYKDSPTTTWINVDGIHDVGLIERIGEHFGIHPLVLEDIASVGQRPKLEEYDDFLYIVVKMLSFDGERGETSSEQVSLVVGERFVISFQEREGDLFEPIRERLRNHKGRIMKFGPDYLAYSLLDVIVDGYFDIIDQTGDRIERIEEELVSNPEPATLTAIQRMKREMIFLRRSVWPLREVVSGLERSESTLLDGKLAPYLRDLYDHTIQVIDAVEALRDTITGILDIYLSSVSNRMNEVMKVLTIIATIFIPLTFIAGVYGMNFEYMPELGYRLAYPVVWIVMGIVTLGMIIYFRRRKWL